MKATIENNRKAEMVGELQFVRPLPDWYDPDAYTDAPLENMGISFWFKHLNGMSRARDMIPIQTDTGIRLLPKRLDRIYMKNYLREFAGIDEEQLDKYVIVFTVLDDVQYEHEVNQLKSETSKQSQPASEQAAKPEPEIGDGATEGRQPWQ